MITIKRLCEQAHLYAVEKGFWGVCNKYCTKKGTAFCILSCDDKSSGQRNLSELLMLVVSELGEACEALRKDSRQCKAEECKKGDWRWQKDTFEDELADAIIRICDLAESEGIDLEWQIKQKLAYNKTRPTKHGKAF